VALLITEGRTLISGARDNTLRLWNAITCTTLREIFDRKQGVNGKHRADIRRAVMLPQAPQRDPTQVQQQQRLLLTASMDGTLRVWHLVSDEVPATAPPAAKQSSSASGARQSEADLLFLGVGGAAGDGDGAGAVLAATALCSPWPASAPRRCHIRIPLMRSTSGVGWDDVTKALLVEILAGKGAVDVAVGEAGHDLCLASLSFFDRDVGVSSLALNPNPARPIVALSSSAHSIALLALRTDTVPWLLRQAEGTLPAGVLPAGTDLAPLTQVQSFSGHSGAVTGVALLPGEETLVSSSADAQVSVYDINSFDRRETFSFGASALCLALAPVDAGKPVQFVFVGGADYVIRAYSTNPQDYAALAAAYAALPVPQPIARHDFEAARYVGHAGRIETIAIHPNGRMMASGGRDWSVLLWSLVNPPPALTVSTRQQRDRGVALTGVYILSYSAPIRRSTPRDESAVRTVSPLARVDAHRGFVSRLGLSPLSVGGGLLASAGNDHAVRVWRVSTGSLLSSAGMERLWESSAAPDAGGHVGAVSALSVGGRLGR